MKTFNCKNTGCNRPVPYDEKSIGSSVQCPYCKHNHNLKAKAQPAPPPLIVPTPVPEAKAQPAPPPPIVPPIPIVPDRTDVEAPGFLVVQDGSEQIFELKVGQNVIGRSNPSAVQPNIALVTKDDRISKRHCVVEVIPTAQGFRYLLYDIGRIESKPSTNGTFVKNTVLTVRSAQGSLEYTVMVLVHLSVFQIGQTRVLLQTLNTASLKQGIGGTMIM